MRCAGAPACTNVNMFALRSGIALAPACGFRSSVRSCALRSAGGAHARRGLRIANRNCGAQRFRRSGFGERTSRRRARARDALGRAQPTARASASAPPRTPPVRATARDGVPDAGRTQAPPEVAMWGSAAGVAPARSAPPAVELPGRGGKSHLRTGACSMAQRRSTAAGRSGMPLPERRPCLTLTAALRECHSRVAEHVRRPTRASPKSLRVRARCLRLRAVAATQYVTAHPWWRSRTRTA